MSGPVVGEEGNAGCILAAGGAFAVLFGTAWLLEKVMPTSIASTIAWVALVVFLVLVWKYGFKGRRNALLGSAAFGGIDDVRALASNKGDLLIGRSFRKLLRYDGPAHLLTMAPTRTGKGVGTIIPNLLTADRSVICIDPKGENAKDRRPRPPASSGRSTSSTPSASPGMPSAAFNPLDQLDPAGLDVAEDASTWPTPSCSMNRAWPARRIGTRKPRR
jgi:type IV secretion system protein VirD4